MIKAIKEFAIGFYILMVAFSFSICFIFEYLLGYGNGKSLIVVVSGIILAISIFWAICNLKIIFQNKRPILLLLLLIVLYSFTSFINNNTVQYNAYLREMVNPYHLYLSYFEDIFARMTPSIIVGILISNKIKYLGYIEKALAPFMLIYTIVVFGVEKVAAVKSELSLMQFSNFDYQTLSYYASYAYAINLYIINKIENRKFLLKLLCFVLALVQIYLVIIPGGRGGFVLLLVISIYFALKHFSIKKLLIICFLIPIIYTTVSLLQNATYNIGFERLFDFFGNSTAITADGRNNLYVNALQKWLESPFFGNGIGSVWFVLGFYSHNIFCDLLCEGGIILFGFYLYLLKMFYKKTRILRVIDSRYEIFIVIFICSFVQLMFSSYYISDSGTWFVFTFAYSCHIFKNSSKVSNSSILK